MIAVYLVRHAAAVPALAGDRGSEPGERRATAQPASGGREAPRLSDDDRPLTSKGRRKFRKVARAFASLGEPVTLVVTSPLPRAVQTAELFARGARCDEVAIAEALRPGRAPADALAEVRALRAEAGATGGVALVGHEPSMSALVEALLGSKQPPLDFKKGAIFRFDADALPPKKPAKFRWWLEPGSGERRSKLPRVEG